MIPTATPFGDTTVPASVDARGAAALRACHDIAAGPPAPAPAWRKLSALLPWLDNVRDHCAEPQPHVARAAEWLLDNEFQLRRAVRQVRKDLPPSFYRRLPRLVAPEYQGIPRVLALARGMLDVTQMQASLAGSVDFVNAYQRDGPLTIAEIWAFPTMLRLVCLEELVQSFFMLLPELPAPFESTPRSTLHQALDPTEGVSRAISALVTISNIPWKVFFEQVSRVEAILQDDPAGVYSAMDFDTRDRYRKAVEDIADGAPASEWEVAQAALELAHAHAGARRSGHIGCWLVAEGRAELERQVGFRAGWRASWRRWIMAHPGRSYAGAVTGFTAAALLLPALLLAMADAGATVWLAGFALSLTPAMIIGVTFTHRLVSWSVPPRVLPKLAIEHGLDANCETTLVVPVILRHEAEVAPLIERLETHWLSNPDPLMRMALLSDLADADTEHTPADALIETALVAGLRRLNARYAGQAPFVLLHRRRRWNVAEGCWMGWERKRGKLEELVGLILGHRRDAFALREGDIKALCRTRFVVTLDADTLAQPDDINRLVGTLAHPLNRVEFDPATGRPIHGYTFIQPRVEISPDAGEQSLFSRLYSGDTAIDIYSRAVSDVYQDLFGEGIFTGKGAFDVAAFHECLHERVPENAILSHDLFEGLHGRAALASDIVFYEDFPANYLAYARRALRWIRGDWQLAPWLSGIVPGRGDRRIANRLSALDRWKVFDNLRRSLIGPMLVVLATAGWLFLPGQALIWTVLAVGAPGAHLFIDLISRLARGRRKPGAMRSMLRPLAGHAGRWLLAVIFLAHTAAVSSEAIVRTLWRVHVSHRRLLEWTSAAHSAAAVSQTWLSTWREMAAAPLLAAVIALTLTWLNPAALAGAAPLLLLWFVSPQVAWLISRPRQPVSEILGAEDRLYLRLIARRTWLYFETFAGPDDNWLAPDNYQTAPHEDIAHRSSPTNVGMLFLSALTAWDLGHIGRRDLAARTAAALDALDRLESHAGHTLNWFDTRTLESLTPRYVSTVDSGNLAVSLLTLAAGCREAATGPALSPARWDGLEDVLHLLQEAVSVLAKEDRAAIAVHLDAIVNRLPEIRHAPQDWRSALVQIGTDEWRSAQIRIAKVLETAVEADPHEIHLWLKRVDHHLMTMQRDLDALTPWLALAETSSPGLDGVSMLLEALPSPDVPLTEMTHRIDRTRRALAQLVPQGPESQRWIAEMTTALDRGEGACRALHDNLRHCAARAEARAFGMDFHPLYDEETNTFFIGYDLDSHRLDPHHYDLLASEARLASYFAIAKRDVPVKHWFHLGRPISNAAGALTMLSWNGSMFEYLMPALLLPSEAGRLLGQSERAAVTIQQRYGEMLGLPWGVSESGFAARDDTHRYQYQAFGVPGLGLRRGLSDDYVVAPYASALALSVAPAAATANLRRLDALGLRDRYGFFEAADFTPDRLPLKGGFVPVRAYMAHHQGMICAAIGNALNDDILIRRFGREPRMRATELLLQERVPWDFLPEQATEINVTTADLTRIPTPALHGWTAPDQPGPQLHVIGNGSLAAWISNAGDSALWWRGQALTRWTGDSVRRGGEMRIHISERKSGAIWSLGGHGLNRMSDTSYHAHKIEFHERREGLSTSLEIVIAPSDDVEIRRITLSNDSDQAREIAVTSYAEVVLAPAASYERHPAFSKLFIHSERQDDLNALIFERRPRRLDDQPPVLLHRLLSTDVAVTPTGFETDRRRFLGRHGDPERPLGATGALDGVVGWTLDPVMALQAHVVLAPGAQARIDFVTIAADSRDTALEIAERFATGTALDWATEDARRTAAFEAQRLGLDSRTLAEAQVLCRDLIFPRTPPILLLVADMTLPAQPHLWSMGLSGDLPIVLVRVVDEAHATLLPGIIRAHRWWQRCGLRADLVFLQERSSGYQDPIRDLLFATLRDANVPEGLGGPGGVHLLATERIGAVERRTLKAVARVTLDAAAGSLATAMAPPRVRRTPLPQFQPLKIPTSKPLHVAPLRRPDNLVFDNSLGGFTPATGDYTIHLDGGRVTPSPWCNVLANDNFGSIVSEAGLGFTWCINSGEHRLTPWSNDPVVDPQSEALYLRDEETADIWTPTPLPAGGHACCQIHHHPGATTWQRNAEGLEQRLTVFVPPDAPVKLVLLTLVNPNDYGRRFTATYYAEWLLGSMTSAARPHLVCDFDTDSQALIARNGWNPEFGERTAFLAASRQPHSLTCDRAAFLGRPGNPAQPAGLVAWSLDGALDNVADPCAAFQVHIDLAPGATEDLVFVLGEGSDSSEAARLATHWANVETAKRGLADNDAVWKRRLGAVQVTTPDPAFDLLVNRWFINQTFASRLLARAGFQQAGGAFGFRDQLQDMMALLFIEPQRVRAHILESAAHQFEEGDVLHWWHPPQGRGVRTRCSDDLLWLVYATGRYVDATGDIFILTEKIPFLSAPPLAAGEEDRYAAFETGEELGTLFEHCRRALDRGVTAGSHGLPLIGAGDWNDGMDRVGAEGRGESIWLAWFAATCVDIFADLAKEIGRHDLGNLWRPRADDLRRAADTAGWDGAWYVRAFADDGLPWGSKDSEECQIDSISQSWAALADGLSPERTAAAVTAATERLVDHDARLVRLLTPPFDRTLRDPGYIRAYPPGVRENGGQYTHAAAWLGLAHARLGNGDLAYEIFDLINPIRHTDHLRGAELYRGEPYVLAADVRGAGPDMSQAGWTWYTGAAGWSWQLAVEGILGLSLQRGTVRIAPRIPTNWGGATVRINGPDGVLIVTIEDPDHLGTGRAELSVDGRPMEGDCIAIPTDGTTQCVSVRLKQMS